MACGEMLVILTTCDQDRAHFSSPAKKIRETENGLFGGLGAGRPGTFCHFGSRCQIVISDG